MSSPRYPDIEIKITGSDFATISQVTVALRRNGVPLEEQIEFSENAVAGDRAALEDFLREWVTVVS